MAHRRNCFQTLHAARIPATVGSWRSAPSRVRTAKASCSWSGMLTVNWNEIHWRDFVVKCLPFYSKRSRERPAIGDTQDIIAQLCFQCRIGRLTLTCRTGEACCFLLVVVAVVVLPLLYLEKGTRTVEEGHSIVMRTSWQLCACKVGCSLKSKNLRFICDCLTWQTRIAELRCILKSDFDFTLSPHQRLRRFCSGCAGIYLMLLFRPRFSIISTGKPFCDLTNRFVILPLFEVWAPDEQAVHRTSPNFRWFSSRLVTKPELCVECDREGE